MQAFQDAVQHRTVVGRVIGRWPGPVWIVGTTVYLLLVPTRVVSTDVAQVINDLSWTVASIAAVLGCWRVARSVEGTERTAWVIFTAANGAWAAGQVAWDVYELMLKVDAPYPSVADIGYIGYGFLMIAGLLVLRVTQHQHRLTWVRVTNLGLILCSLAVLVIVMLTQPFRQSVYDVPTTLVIVIESGAIVVACIFALYLLWSYDWGACLSSTALIAGALVTQTVAMLLYTRQLIVAEYGVNSSFNVVWLVAFALQHFAARSRLLSTSQDHAKDATPMSPSHGLVETVLPGVLLLCLALTGIILANEMTRSMSHFAYAMLGVFAIVLSIREGVLYAQGVKFHSKLRQASSLVADLEARRADLEREMDVMSRAGGVGMWDWALATSTVKYSPEWKRQLGHAETEIGDTFAEWRDRLHPDDRERAMRTVESFLAAPDGELVSELRLRHRDGSYRWILTRASMLKDASGKAFRVMGSHVDITERKSIELSLRESEARYRTLVDELEHRVAARTAELSDAYRESRSFAYAVAHDLKAPLRAMDGFGHLLEDKLASRMAAEERSYLERIRRGARHMSQLIDGLLEYSRIEHRELSLSQLELRACVMDVVASMDAQIQAANAVVYCEVEAVDVCVDEQGLKLVIRNLFDNALKFRSPDRPPQIEISSYHEGSYRVLKVKDNGIGFDQQYAGKIFDIFNRLHAAGFEGTGIGLALVRKAVHRMHGRIWAESEPNVGSAFYVALATRPNGPVDRACH